MVKLLFVCLGNICRSPAGEGIMQKMVIDKGLGDEIFVDSAGTGGWHTGELPDKRMRAASKARGIILQSRARRFEADDLNEFDYVVAMDKSNYNDIMYHAGNLGEYRAEVLLMTDFLKVNNFPDGVPDPYSYGKSQFELVLDILMETCEALLKKIIYEHNL